MDGLLDSIFFSLTDANFVESITRLTRQPAVTVHYIETYPIT